MKYTGTFLTAALLAAATPAVPAWAAGSPPVIDTAYWTEQPYCSGRYQLRLPAIRRHSSSWIEYNGWSVMVLFNDWARQMQDIRKFEHSGSYGATNIFIGSRTLIPGRAVMFATRRDFDWDGLFTKTDGMPYETNLIFKLDKDDAYIVSGYFRIPSNNGKEPANWKAKEKEMLDGMEKRYRADFLKGLRERQEYEVPNQSGICLIRGFIADDGGKPFKANTAVRFAKQTDMRLEMLHGAVLQPGEPTLLERDLVSEKSALAKIFKTAGYRTIRQGKRDVNGMSGTEKLIKWQGNKYMLIWERDGGDPRIMMKFGADRAEGTSRSEAEILAIWDTVLPTLKPVK